MSTRNTAAAVGVMLMLASGWARAQTIYRLTDLGTLPEGLQSLAINHSGQVTGHFFTESDPPDEHAFLWDGSTLRDLAPFDPGDCASLDGCDSSGYAINDSGQVTGFYTTTKGDDHAFLWDGTTLQDLGTLGVYSQGLAINASGQVTGDSNGHAFLWDGTRMRDLGTLGGTSAGIAINASGQVTGSSSTTGNAASHAFLWDGTRMRDLGTLGGSNSGGRAINASGQVTGDSRTTGDAASHAFLWDGTTLRDLGTLGGRDSFSAAINASGQVTGSSSTSGNAASHAFLWDGTTLRDLGTLGGSNSGGIAINASGQVTGSSSTTGNAASHAFLWDGTALRDLNNLVDPTDPLRSFVTLTAAGDIDDRGEILASGVDRRTGQKLHWYLVSPVPDTTPPVITPVVTGILGGQGWYRSTVTVTWEVTDAQSAISATAGCGRVVLFTDTPGKTFACRATSNGGRRTKSITIKRDTTSPAVLIGAPIDGRTYHRHQKVKAAYICTDQTSGIKQCLGTVPTGAGIDTASTGTKSFTVNARDPAGNQRVIRIHYRVVD